jgi:hypothetical protein
MVGDIIPDTIAFGQNGSAPRFLRGRALGREVTSLQVGDRVLAMAEQGGYAEAVTVRGAK